jgi:type I restriction-modification system DNA methylase subunit
MITKEDAYKKIEKLVKRFAEQIDSYKALDYNETLTRRDFIDPFFKALGWDMDNEQGFAEAYREVIHEDKVKIGSATKAPDYSFRLGGGKRLFFVEAKKPSVALKDEILPAYQVRRYGWSAKLSISIITDFEEFAIYDCTKKPNPTDKASVARIKYLLFKDYLKEFDFIWDTFSKEKVLTGSFDKYVQTGTYKKGTASVDKEFLQSLDNWRTYLATSISWNNKELDEDEINFAVQQIIDRIIFLRIAEDRGVEPYGILKHNLKQGDYYQNLFEQFHKADEKYNSGLFDFKKDQLSKHLKIENKVIKTIIDELYYPECPYEFSVLSVEILGSAYEQFLGKVIRITPAHHAKIEEKPEVRKAGGVYYTPQYIVDYIIKNTVEKLVDRKSPKEISKIKIVDPACGSGSFLLGAYQHLLDYHKNYYAEKGKISKGNKNSMLTPEGNLTTNEKKRILLNNIFGVDIDVNAVEVTKLSLLLKCMEGETEASIATQMKLFHERILPTLDGNIKDGNSLVDIDFYSGELDFGFEKKIKPFSWQKAFPEIFKTRKPALNETLKYHNLNILKQSEEAEKKAKELIRKFGGNVEEPVINYGNQEGFDIVIGNPPYRLMQPKDTDQSLLQYFRNKFNIADFKIDLFHLFFQKGIQLLKDKGSLGFIAPSSLLNNVYAENLRNWLNLNCIINVIALSKERVFSDADVYTAVYLLTKESNKSFKANNFVKTTIELEQKKQNVEINYRLIKQERFKGFDGNVWNVLVNEENVDIIDKIKSDCESLGSISEINRGLITGDRDKYFSLTKKDKNYKPILSGSDIFRYYNNPSSEFVFFIRPKSAGGCWDEEVHFAKHKIVIRQIGLCPTATLLEKPLAVTGNIFTIKSKSLEFEKYLVGIINSRIIEYYWKIMFADFKATFPQVTIFSLNSIPVKTNPDKKYYDEIIKLVDQLLKLNEEIREIKLQTKINQLQSKIDYCEDRINEIVYQLYGLAKEEIKIVEKEL